jgi:TRAP-type C4-dicarboxylate transport system substrate-binding protein
LPVLDALHFYDCAKYVLETDHAAVTTVCVLSKVWYDSLDPALKVAVEAAGAEADMGIGTRAVEVMTRSRQAWASHGGSLASLSSEDRAELVELLHPIGERVTASNPGERSILELLTKTAAQV